jgi:hypothetical protein
LARSGLSRAKVSSKAVLGFLVHTACNFFRLLSFLKEKKAVYEITVVSVYLPPPYIFLKFLNLFLMKLAILHAVSVMDILTEPYQFLHFENCARS